MAEEAIGKADFAEALRGVKVRNVGRVTVRLTQAAGGLVEVDADLFRVFGLGFDDIAFFVATDPTLPVEGFGAGIHHAPHLFLEGTSRRGTKQEAQLQAVKYLLRIPELERLFAADAMREHGGLWRAKR